MEIKEQAFQTFAGKTIISIDVIGVNAWEFLFEDGTSATLGTEVYGSIPIWPEEDIEKKQNKVASEIIDKILSEERTTS